MSMELSYDMKNFQRNMQCISEKKKGVISIGIYNALCSAYQISLDHSFSG